MGNLFDDPDCLSIILKITSRFKNTLATMNKQGTVIRNASLRLRMQITMMTTIIEKISNSTLWAICIQ